MTTSKANLKFEKVETALRKLANREKAKFYPRFFRACPGAVSVFETTSFVYAENHAAVLDEKFPKTQRDRILKGQL